MFFGSILSANVALAYSAYAIGVASPGPSNLAVMATAMRSGRRSAIVFALGVVSGSAFWGLLASFGLSAVIAEYSGALLLMKFAGGAYLLWLSFKSLRSALSKDVLSSDYATPSDTQILRLYYRGAAMHLTNPKAIFVWLSAITLALKNSSQQADALPIVVGCISIGAVIFCGYAILFSTSSARMIYSRARRWFDAVMTSIFGIAGIRMIVSSIRG